jgi:cytochrome c
MLIRIIVIAGLFALAACASAPRDSLRWGRELAQGNCAACHAIGPIGGSPNAFAPAFRDIYKTHDFARVREDLGRGAQINGHPPMPSFALRPRDLTDLIDYIQSLQPPSRP